MQQCGSRWGSTFGSANLQIRFNSKNFYSEFFSPKIGFQIVQIRENLRKPVRLIRKQSLPKRATSINRTENSCNLFAAERFVTFQGTRIDQHEKKFVLFRLADIARQSLKKRRSQANEYHICIMRGPDMTILCCKFACRHTSEKPYALYLKTSTMKQDKHKQKLNFMWTIFSIVIKGLAHPSMQQLMCN